MVRGLEGEGSGAEVEGVAGALFVADQLPGVDHVLPGDVGGGGYGGYGVHVGEGKPNGEDGVLLREALAAGYFVAEVSSYFASYCKLHEAYGQCSYGEGDHGPCVVRSPMTDGKAHATTHYDKEGYRPKIE